MEGGKEIGGRGLMENEGIKKPGRKWKKKKKGQSR